MRVAPLMLAALHPLKGYAAWFLCGLLHLSRELARRGTYERFWEAARRPLFKRAMVGGCVVEAGVADWPTCLRWWVWVRGWGTGMY